MRSGRLKRGVGVRWLDPTSCPIKEFTEALGGRLKKDRSCQICPVSPDFCLSYRLGEPRTLVFMARWLWLAERLKWRPKP